jgi:hypothetical protein
LTCIGFNPSQSLSIRVVSGLNEHSLMDLDSIPPDGAVGNAKAGVVQADVVPEVGAKMYHLYFFWGKVKFTPSKFSPSPVTPNLKFALVYPHYLSN